MVLKAESLKNLLHKSDLSRKDRVLLILAVDVERPKTSAEIKLLAINSGLRAAKGWGIASILSRGDVLAIRVADGWELNDAGRRYVAEIAAGHLVSPAMQSATDLRVHLTNITDPNTVAFLEEAISCLEANLLRAAVVLSWVGAVAVMYRYIVDNALPQFNAEAKRRDSKWKDAKNADDLARMKEYEFLNVIEAISIIGKNVKQELQNNCLQLRNACGHPNSLAIGANRAAAHIETLILNVFSRF
ncbi:MAG TPA: hypothetical protein VF212_04455 [Longimicrobiales bacterium]